MFRNSEKMNILYPVLLFHLYCATVSWAILSDRFLPTFSTVKQSASVGTTDAGEPLLLTPLIDAGKRQEAVRRSQVQPFLGYVENYAGFLTVNRTTKSHLFFWFVPKIYVTADSENAPLILWLQGGPGISALHAMFTENGPLKLTKKANSMQQRPHAWTNKYHMLYIDQPVGTGFSFTEREQGYVRTQEEAAEHVYEALLQFYKLYPQFRDRGLYIAGESYAGKFVAAVGYKIHSVSRRWRQSGDSLPLKGLMIGSGHTDPENMLDYATYLHGIGLADEGQRANLQMWQDIIRYTIRSGNWSLAGNYCNNFAAEIIAAVNTTSLYDYTREEFTLDDSFIPFLTRDDIRKRIHVGRIKYEMFSKTVYRHLRGDILRSVRPWMEELLEHYPILFYSGQLDILGAYPLIENSLRQMRWSGAMKYHRASSRAWRVDGKLAGFYKSAGNLVRVLVRNAGHIVPADQPKNALALIEMFIEKRFQDRV